jgi:hypothetical protein
MQRLRVACRKTSKEFIPPVKYFRGRTARVLIYSSLDLQQSGADVGQTTD